MKKRELFAELQEGFDALSDSRTGKQTLRTHIVEDYVAPMVTAEELVSLRNRLNLSRPVFANYLRMVAREGIEPPTRGFSMACCKFSDYFSIIYIFKIRVCYRMC
jgi:hypothetical protein